MSGAGYRVWQAGEKLLDTNFQNYLQDQTVMRFASASARSSAITSPVEGMMTTLDDTDLLYRYNGTAWVEAGGGGGGASLADIFLLAGM